MRECAVRGLQEQCAGCCAASFEDPAVPGLILALNTHTHPVYQWNNYGTHMNLWFSQNCLLVIPVLCYKNRALGVNIFIED